MGKSLEARVGGPNSLKALNKMGLTVDGSHPSFANMTTVPYRTESGGTLTYTDMRQSIPVRPITVIDYTGETPREYTVFKPTNRALKEITGNS